MIMITQENIQYTADEVKAMVKTIEELRKKYNEALERARYYHSKDYMLINSAIENIFPELKDDKDGWIKDDIKDVIQAAIIPKESKREMIAWLEKQGEKKSADEVLKIRQELYQSGYNDGYKHGQEDMANKEYVFRPVAGTMIENAVEQALKQGDVVLAFNGFYTPVKGKTSDEILTEYDNYWLEKQGEQKQTWKPSAAQLIVIKDLIEDKNTSKVHKVILRGMFDEFKQFTNNHKREIDDAYLQGICDAKHAIEKQGEQTTDKIEPKFKVDDWIVKNDSGGIFQVTEIRDDKYFLCPLNGFFGCELLGYFKIIDVDNDYHLWTIQDAKDGDVLVNGSNIFIFHFLKGGKRLMGYCHVNMDNELFLYDDVGKSECFCTIDAIVTPATKEQRDLLFSKIKQAGYEWDAEKKELKKIEVKSENIEPKKLYADKVIAWLVANICDYEYYIKWFKQDFGL